MKREAAACRERSPPGYFAIMRPGPPPSPSPPPPPPRPGAPASEPSSPQRWRQTRGARRGGVRGGTGAAAAAMRGRGRRRERDRERAGSRARASRGMVRRRGWLFAVKGLALRGEGVGAIQCYALHCTCTIAGKRMRTPSMYFSIRV